MPGENYGIFTEAMTRQKLPLAVVNCGDLFSIGTIDAQGQLYLFESHDDFSSKELAEAALAGGNWRQIKLHRPTILDRLCSAFWCSLPSFLRNLNPVYGQFKDVEPVSLKNK